MVLRWKDRCQKGRLTSKSVLIKAKTKQILGLFVPCSPNVSSNLKQNRIDFDICPRRARFWLLQWYSDVSILEEIWFLVKLSNWFHRLLRDDFQFWSFLLPHLHSFLYPLLYRQRHTKDEDEIEGQWKLNNPSIQFLYLSFTENFYKIISTHISSHDCCSSSDVCVCLYPFSNLF